MKLLSSDKNNKEKVFKNYIVENKDSFYRMAYSYTKNEDDALDIVQESICKGLSKVNKLKDINCIKSWFYRILINSAVDYIRKNKKYLSIDEEELNNKYIHNDIYVDLDLHRALDILPYEYKSVIILRYFEDMKINEIADVLNENVNTIKTRLYSALKKLKIEINQ
ncbi:MAG: sigma-70 family RNA polymerase sigma factor [Romboutsia sp.]